MKRGSPEEGRDQVRN